MHAKYHDNTISLIFDAANTRRHWYAIERAICPDLPPDLVIDSQFMLDCARAEEVTGHEVYAFLGVLDQRLIQLDLPTLTARRKIHYGLTSSDLVDTTTAIQMRHVTAHLDHLAHNMRHLPVFDDVSLVLARTHGVVAGFTTLGHRLRAKFPDRLTRLDPTIKFYGKLSGAVGTRLALDADRERELLAEFGLYATDATQIIYRGHWQPVLDRWLAQIEVCEAICTDYRLMWAFDEIDTGTFSRIGSSAMPHKRNPIEAEQVCGLAKVARALHSALRVSNSSWLDRDLSNSSVERICLPDLAHLAAYCLTATSKILSNLVLSQGGLMNLADLSEAMLLAATDLWDVPRLDLHRRLRELTRDGEVSGDDLDVFIQTLNIETGLIGDARVATGDYLDRVHQYASLTPTT